MNSGANTKPASSLMTSIGIVSTTNKPRVENKSAKHKNGNDSLIGLPLSSIFPLGIIINIEPSDGAETKKVRVKKERSFALAIWSITGAIDV